MISDVPKYHADTGGKLNFISRDYRITQEEEDVKVWRRGGSVTGRGRGGSLRYTLHRTCDFIVVDPRDQHVEAPGNEIEHQNRNAECRVIAAKAQ